MDKTPAFHEPPCPHCGGSKTRLVGKSQVKSADASATTYAYLCLRCDNDFTRVIAAGNTPETQETV